MIPFSLMIGGIHQHSDDFLRIETYTQVHRTFRFRLQGQDQILLVLAGQFVVYISIGVCSHQDRHGFAQFLQCYMAVLLQRTDTMQPVQIARIGSIETNMADIESIGGQNGTMRQPPCLYGKGIGIQKTDLTLQSHDFVPTTVGFGFSSVQHRVESGRGKTGRTVRFHIRAKQQVGPVAVLRIFVIAV